jgi:thioredoxin 1
LVAIDQAAILRLRLTERGILMEETNVIQVSDQEFEKEILQSKIPTLVDFWASWCGPCLAMAPTVEQVAVKFSGKIKVAKMNVDENRTTPGKYGIMSIPTLIFFKDGQIVDRIVGVVPQARLEGVAKKVLGETH